MFTASRTNKILHSRKAAAELLSISTSTLDRLVRQKRLTPVHIGASVLFTADALANYAETLTKRALRGIREAVAGAA
jgi:excisionase family DNA binding protein